MSAICFGLFIMVCQPQGAAATAVICPPLVGLPATVQHQAAVELRRLPAGDPLRRLAAAAVKQRDLVRRCLQRRR